MWAPPRKSIDKGAGRPVRGAPCGRPVIGDRVPARRTTAPRPQAPVTPSEHHAGPLVIAHARGEDLHQAGALGGAGLPVAVETLLYGLVHALQRAGVDVARYGPARHHATGGVDLEALGAGPCGTVVEDAPPGVGSGVDEFALGVEAAVDRPGRARSYHAHAGVLPQVGHPLVDDLEGQQGLVVAVLEGHDVREPDDHVALGRAGVTDAGAGGERLHRVVHVEFALAVVAPVDGGDVQLPAVVEARVHDSLYGALVGLRARRRGAAVRAQRHVARAPGVELGGILA